MTDKPLSAEEIFALEIMRDCTAPHDGWAVLSSDRSTHVAADGQVQVYWKTGVSLIRRGLAERDEGDGIRLKDQTEGTDAS